MNKFIVILFLAVFQASLGQDLNAYRYVVVPMEYDFLKEPNQYKLAELTKFLFEKEGFEAYIEGNVPEHLRGNSCEALHADIEEDPGLFVTRLAVSLKDCNNTEVFKSEEGKSREKDYGKAYHEALRNAFKSIAVLNYEYQKPVNVVEVTGIPQQAANTVKGEVQKSLPKPQEKEEASNEEKPLNNLAKKVLTFSRDNGIYYLQKTSSGFNFYQKGMAEPFAALVKSSAGESFIYSSVTSKGVASFNQEGDLVVEFLDPGTGELNLIIYKKQAQ